MRESLKTKSLAASAALSASLMPGGLNSSFSSHFGILKGLKGSLVVLCPERLSQERLLRDIQFFLPSAKGFFAWDTLPFEHVSPASLVTAQRLEILHGLSLGEQQLIVTTPRALVQKLVPRAMFRSAIFSLHKGQELSREELFSKLDFAGFNRVSLVEEPGDFASRGAVVDFFSPGQLVPTRVEMFGDRIDSIRHFESDSQRSSKQLEVIDVLPSREFILPAQERKQALEKLHLRASELSVPRSSYDYLEQAISSGARWPGLEAFQSFLVSSSETLIDYLGEESRFIVLDLETSKRNTSDFFELIEERGVVEENSGRVFPPIEDSFILPDEVFRLIQDKTTLELESESLFDAQEKDDVLEIEPLGQVSTLIKANRSSKSPLSGVVNFFQNSSKNGLDTLLVVSTQARAERLASLLEPYGFKDFLYHKTFLDWLSFREENPQARGEVSIIIGAFSESSLVCNQQFQIISEADLFSEARRHKKTVLPHHIKKFIKPRQSFEKNDFVVHLDYGIGTYLGLKTISVDGKQGDFVEVEYAENAKLFLPVDNISKLQKYVGVEGSDPKLSVLGGTAWAKARKKVEDRVMQLAGELLQLYAEREVVEGFSFGEMDEEDKQFSDAFPYEETPDQAKAIEDVFADLASTKPMDRLVCGDVGYGKTEVALRAAFKVANTGKQVAILVPTTVLASQHYQNFQERFQYSAIEVGILSRFNTTAENKQIIADVKRGSIDIVIGTHRLLQNDVEFKNLGLVIVDEEHRFGVRHKEKLKKLRKEVDILTLTATPIPRTLQMSMLDIRDLSVIETPPTDRQVTRTYVAPYEDELVREAIKRELSRSGQVFFLHNRVQTIESARDRVLELVPEARIAVGHGQMKKNELEKVMQEFFDHEADILVSTSIIESGLDISNANTIIIENANQFGLAELYQLRGRVGRSSRRAYCYLLIDEDANLTDSAKKRLKVLKSLDDLGVGFRLALQDMEIRGAGNLLGKDQSGNVNVVGFDLFSKILKRAVNQINEGKSVELSLDSIDPEVSIGFPAYLPDDYIPDLGEKLLLYQRLVQIADRQEACSMAEEIEDRFGKFPAEVDLLLELMIFRAKLKELGFDKAKISNGELFLSIHSSSKIDRDKIISLANSKPNSFRLTPGSKLAIRLEEFSIPEEGPASPKELTDVVNQFVEDVGFC